MPDLREELRGRPFSCSEPYRNYGVGPYPHGEAWLYLMSVPEISACKLGFTVGSPGSRAKGLLSSTGLFHRVVWAAWIDCAYCAEQFFHTALADHRVRGMRSREHYVVKGGRSYVPPSELPEPPIFAMWRAVKAGGTDAR